MATVNNPVVATIECKTYGEVASLHETRRGKGRGLLYKRCGCGCDQRTGQKIQEQWRRELTPREGFEHLKMEPEPRTAPEPSTALEPEPETVPDRVPEPEPNQTKKRRGFMAVMPVIALAGVMLVLTAGRSAGPLA